MQNLAQFPDIQCYGKKCRRTSKYSIKHKLGHITVPTLLKLLCFIHLTHEKSPGRSLLMGKQIN